MRSEPSSPRRRQTPGELAAAQQRREARVLGEVRKGMGSIQSLRARHLRLARLQRELFFGNAALRAAMPWMVGVLVPVFAVVLCRLERVMPQLADPLPGVFFRTVIAYPLLALLCAVAVAAAPWGWLAYLGWMAGTPARVEARVLLIEARRNCVPRGQHARLEFGGTVARICVEERLAAKAPGTGDTVAVYGRVSRMGLYVREIHAK